MHTYTHTHTHTHTLEFLQSSQEESTDSGPLKNYILCSDCEEETKAWIAAITEEIKPMLGVSSFGNRGGGKTAAIKVDQKAFDEVHNNLKHNILARSTCFAVSQILNHSCLVQL